MRMFWSWCHFKLFITKIFHKRKQQLDTITSFVRRSIKFVHMMKLIFLATYEMGHLRLYCCIQKSFCTSCECEKSMYIYSEKTLNIQIYSVKVFQTIYYREDYISYTIHSRFIRINIQGMILNDIILWFLYA